MPEEHFMKKLLIYSVPLLIILLSPFYIYKLNHNECAIITYFGKPVKIENIPGPHFKLPGFLHKVNRFDVRTDIFSTESIQLLLGDKNPLIVSLYTAWKISEPLTYFQTITFREKAVKTVKELINSQVGIVFGEYNINDIINTDRDKVKIKEIEDRILEAADVSASEKYGLSIVSIGITRLAYPLNVEKAVYNRMKSEREKEAAKINAEGQEASSKLKAQTDKEARELIAEAYKKAQIIKGEGDKEAMQIYGKAFEMDPDFFSFTKSLETYESILGKNTTLILSTDSELFKYLNMEDKN